MDLVLYAIPFFFLFILLELGYGILRGRNTYRVNDTINSLSLGSLSRLQGLVILGFSGVIYEWVVARYQLGQLAADSTWVWLSCFVLYDLAYYWKHRFGHEVALFWGSHVAHHQSEDFNLGTALRQTSIDFYGFLFYLPFFFLGYPAEVLFSVASLNLIYQFWVHTEHVPKLGVLEWVLVTPSNHRVHHGRNPRYLDRNYGGVFIVWDRLFGSFQEELDAEPVLFGLRKPLNSFNPLWANLHVYWRLLLDCWQAPGLANKLKIWFKPPGWQPGGQKTCCKLAGAEAAAASKYDPQVSRFVSACTLGQFLVSLGGGLYILLNAGAYSYGQTAAIVLVLGYSLYTHGTWLEARASAPYHEISRVLLLLLVCWPLAAAALVKSLLLGYCLLSVVLALLASRRGSGMIQSAAVADRG